jgi:hypothetical protein
VQSIVAKREYRTGLEDLCGATEDAIAALAVNSLPELQERISRQEVLAARLHAMIKDCHDIASAPALGGDEGELATTIRSLHQRLAVLNRRYAALLSHVKRSADLSLAVCRSCAGSFGREATPTPPTWSCEI